MLLLVNLLLFVVVRTSGLIYRDEIIVSSKEIEEVEDDNINEYNPFVPCDFL
jgi:hypothetical protein